MKVHYTLLAYGCTVQQHAQVLLSSCVATMFYMIAHTRMCMQHASACLHQLCDECITQRHLGHSSSAFVSVSNRHDIQAYRAPAP